MITINFKEKDIEDFLCKDKNLENYLDLKFVARQVEIFGFYIDILAYSIREQCFYIIELKKDLLDDKAFVQATKYRNLMDAKYKFKHKFKTLLIGQNLSEDLFYVIDLYDSSRPTLQNNDFYTLFNYTFDNGIGFNWHTTKEKEAKISLFKKLKGEE